MLQLKGYELKDVIKEGRNSTAFRGKRETDQKSVVVKWLKMSKRYARDLQMLKNEFDIANRVAAKGIVSAYSIMETSEGCALILEDFGGESLRDVQEKTAIPDLKTMLKIAVTLTESLAQIHHKNVIHKDINPGNIIVNPADWQVKITDFGISTGLSREQQGNISANRLEGTLAYISPEQTGRMNRAIDYRTDIYSMGVTFYELFTGQLPHKANDAIGWVHMHIAVEPKALFELHPEIPEVLSDIVSKMMAKNAEDRYQNAYGIKTDLENCLAQMESKGKIEPFALAQKDVSGRFQIPQKLYGREGEIAKLMSTFEKISEGRTELMLVAGFSGIGKSSLVHEIHKPIVGKRGYFISGKFDQYKRNVPYMAIIQAFQGLIEQLATESEENLLDWKEKLLQVLGANGQVIVDIIPEIEVIIGKQRPVPEIGGAESQNRFNATFQKFISVFTKEEHPLVLFLDDLQWADSASLNLIKVLMQDEEIKYLLLIGAYRDNEVNPSHPFIMTVEEIKKTDSLVETLTLAPLQEEFVTQLIAETLNQSTTECAELSSIVMSKTGGNPFFVSEFLRTLYIEEILRFDLQKQSWAWDKQEIAAQGITDNVVDLMVNRMRKLPQKTQQALLYGACIGNVFDLKTLAVVLEEPLADAATDLWPAIQEGMLIPVGETKDLILSSGKAVDGITTVRALKALNKFQHDRVQQAAYSLIDEDQKKKIHLKIGQLILKSSTKEEAEEHVFSIIQQMNKGRDLLTNDADKMQLANLNLMAGAKARINTAYGPAIDSLETAKSLLSESAWDTDYRTTFDVYKELFDSLSLFGKHEESDKIYDIVVEKAKNKEDRFLVYHRKLLSLTATGKNAENLKLAVKALHEWGVDLPEPEEAEKLGEAFGIELSKFDEYIKEKKIEELVDLPVMENTSMQNAALILLTTLDAAFYANPGMLPLVVTKMVNISLEFGNAPASSFGYAWFSLPLIFVREDYALAYRFGKLAVELADRGDDSFIKTRAHHGIGCFTGFWGLHLRDCIVHLHKGLEYGQESGDNNFAAYCATLYNRYGFYSGTNLQELEKEGEISLHFLERVNNQFIYTFHDYLFQAILSLQGKNESYTLVAQTQKDEDESRETWKESALHMALYGICKSQLHYLFEEYEKAEEYGQLGEDFRHGVKPAFDFVEINFYHGLSLAAVYPNAAAEKQNEMMVKLDEYLRELKLWTDICPDNYEPRYLLVLGEKNRVLNHEMEAIKLYDQAIASAQKYEYTHIEALANEVAARFWMKKESTKIAGAYMTDAVNIYRLWGAAAKVKHLSEKYPDLIARSENRQHGFSELATTSASGMATTTDGDITASMGGGLDLNTVVKASQTLAGEIRLEELLIKLMKIVMENAGARRGFLIQERNGEFVITAQSDLDTNVHKIQDVPLDHIEQGNPLLAVTVVRLAARTQNHVLINDAAADDRFTQDPHFIQNKPKSVLCSPIIHQGRLSGLLYLENNLSVGAFTAQRLEILRMLSSQAAISIENASLYSNLEEKVEERTVELRQSKKEIDDIFSNVEQGLLTINPDHTISSEFSRKVVDIFEREDLERMKFDNLFLGNTELQAGIREFLEELFTNLFMSMKLFERTNPLVNYHYEMVNSETRQITKVLDFKFSRIFQTGDDGQPTKTIQKIMVVIDDKTEEYELKKELEKKAEEQASKVEKLYQILQLQPSVFSNFISESSATLEQVHSNLKELGNDVQKNKELLQAVFREVHTLKGNARALNLDSIGKTAHELEDRFEMLKENPEEINEELKEKTFEAVRLLKEDIQDGNALFKKILNMQSALQDKSQDSMGEFEERFRKIVEMEAGATGKPIQFQFKNELETPLKGNIINKLRNPLSHIVRNSVSHGIESADERKKLNKPEAGHVVLTLSKSNGTLIIICEDDGGGLNTNKIRAKAETLKLFSADTLKQMSDSDVNKLIFSSGLSTTDKVTDSAGRGVGMDAVKADLKALQAQIAINTKPNMYTRFTIQIPNAPD